MGLYRRRYLTPFTREDDNMGFEGFRRGARAIQGTRSRKGGNKKGAWALNWKPPKKPDGSPNDVAQPVVFRAGQYDDKYALEDFKQSGKYPIYDFYHHRTHNFRLSPTNFRTVECSAGHDPHAAQPCVGCYECDHGAKGAEPRDQYAFNIAHLWWYHMVPWVKEVNGVQTIQYKKDQTGNFTNEPVLVQKECTLNGCEHCRNQAPVKMGAHRIFDVGSGHLDEIASLDNQAGQRCSNCLTYVKLLGYRCGNPQCPGHAQNLWLMDVATAGLDNAGLAKYASTAAHCTACNTASIPQEIIDCGYDFNRFGKVTLQDGTAAGCYARGQFPKRLTIGDMVIYLQREGEGTKTKLKPVRMMTIAEFSQECSQMLGGRNLVDVLAEIVPEPFDMETLLEPDTLEEQAKRLDKPNPYAQPAQAPSGQQPGYSPYGQVQQAPQSPYQQPPAQPPQVYGGQPAGQPGQPPQVYQQPQQPQQPQHPGFPNVPNTGRPPYGR